MTARIRALAHAACLGLIMVGTVLNARAQTVEADLAPVIADAADHYGISRTWLRSTLSCESGGYRADVVYGPTRGAAGEIGVAQLHPAGELRRFLAVGYDNAFDPSQAIWYTAWRFSVGGARAWTCS